MLKLTVLIPVVLSFIALTGCVNTPTANVQVKDDRPLIMFIGAKHDDVVFIDGIQMGEASQFSAGDAALRIEPGTYNMQVKRAGVTVLNKTFYVADGVSKTFTLGDYK